MLKVSNIKIWSVKYAGFSKYFYHYSLELPEEIAANGIQPYSDIREYTERSLVEIKQYAGNDSTAPMCIWLSPRRHFIEDSGVSEDTFVRIKSNAIKDKIIDFGGEVDWPLLFYPIPPEFIEILDTDPILNMGLKLDDPEVEKYEKWIPANKWHEYKNMTQQTQKQYQPQDVLNEIDKYLPQVIERMNQTGDETEYGTWLKIKQSVKRGTLTPDQAMQQIQQLLQGF